MRRNAGARSGSWVQVAIGLIAVAGCRPEVREGATARAVTTAAPLIAAGSVWKFWDKGSEPSAAPDGGADAAPGPRWFEPAFDDSAWASGPAKLGYGSDIGQTTAIASKAPSGANLHTAYFRRTFDVADPAALALVRLTLLRDDGAVVYLNGTEIRRTNMPAGAVAYGTSATTSVSGNADLTSNSDTIALTAAHLALLRPGVNVLAVEVHQQSATSSDIAFDLELREGVGLRRGPYLQLATPTSVKVRWRTFLPGGGRVFYGASPDALTSMVASTSTTTDHEVTLPSLTPGTKYFYAVATPAETLAGGDADHTFHTPPAAGAKKRTRIWALGDPGVAGRDSTTPAQLAAQTTVRDAYYALTGAQHTDVWLMLGDNVYNAGSDVEFQRGLFDIYPRLLRQSFLWPTIGNHDTNGRHDLASTTASPYFGIFSLPAAAEAGGVASGTERYYSFDHGDIHFVCLDSMTTTTESSTAARTLPGDMLTWLESDLAANTKPWVIAFFHHPPYSKGGHDSDSTVDGSYESGLMRRGAGPILEKYGVDLVLSGHSHSYERSYLIDGHQGASTTFDPAVHAKAFRGGRAGADGPYRKATLGKGPSATGANEGAVYVVAGSGGQVTGGALNHPAMFVSFARLGSVVIDVDDGRMDVRFLRENGFIDDTFTIVKGEQTNALPKVSVTVPAGVPHGTPVTATATASDDDGIARLELLRAPGGSLGVATGGATTFTHQVSFDADEGAHQVFAVATDAKGATSTSLPAQVIVSPRAPKDVVATGGAQQVALTWKDDSAVEQGFRIERSSDGVAFAPYGSTRANVTTFVDTGLPPNTTMHYRVRAFLDTAQSSASAPVSATTTGDAATTLVAAGSSWRYLDDGSEQGSAWRARVFDDGTWQQGSAQLGYGDGDEATVVGFGADPNAKHITTYFRRRFHVVDPAAITAVTLRLLRDDSAVVYLNETEVFRSNLPVGAVDRSTRAATSVSGSAENAWHDVGIDPALLRAGENVLAVEVHQDLPDSSDVSFDLELLRATTPLAPPAPFGLTARALAPRKVQLAWGDPATVETGFRVERRAGSAAFAEIGATAANVTAFVDTTAQAGTAYQYQVRAVNATGPSAPSTIAAVTTPACAATETCNGEDDDCDGNVDQGLAPLSCGVGECARTIAACANGAPQVCTPGAPGAESCNGKDDDCDGSVDQGLGTQSCGAGACRQTVAACADGAPVACVPGQPSVESCNGIDDDCDDVVDEELGQIACGVGACRREVSACALGMPQTCTAGAAGTETCNGVDDDCDGATDEALGQIACGVGACRRTVDSCAGGAPQTCTAGAPGVETCNAVDDDCDGTVDEALGQIACGVGACRRTVDSCAGGAAQTCTPGAPGVEACNGVDDDCDGTVDEALGQTSCGVGACRRTVDSCAGGQPQACTPGAPNNEACNGADDDCDGTVDEGFGQSVCGVGACQRTVDNCRGGAFQACMPGAPSTEICNGIDDDCDGIVDEGLGQASCGVGACTRTVDACVLGTPQTCAPRAPMAESCNGVDDDCNGNVDDGYGVGAPCTVGVGACARSGLVQCLTAGTGTICAANPGLPTDEVCNGVDDDCNGKVDDHVCTPPPPPPPPRACSYGGRGSDAGAMAWGLALMVGVAVVRRRRRR